MLTIGTTPQKIGASQTENPAGGPSNRAALMNGRRSARLKRLTVAATLVAAVSAGVFLFVAGPRVWRRVAPDSAATQARTDLARALAGQRLVHGRLAGTAHGAFARTRSAGETSTDRLPDVRIAAATIEQLALETGSPRAFYALGAARLVMGDPSASIRAIEASGLAGADAGAANDLAVAYYERYRHKHRFNDLAVALEAAQRAVALDASLAEGLFNLALALESSGLRAQARATWQECLRRDDGSGWANEAKQALERLALADVTWDQWRTHAQLRPEGPLPADLPVVLARFAQPLREWLQRDVAAAWATAVMDGDAAAQRKIARTAVDGGQLLFVATGDRMARDVGEEYERGINLRLLAAGHRAYAAAISAYQAHEYEDARRHIVAARQSLIASRSVQALWAAVQLAVVQYQMRDLAAATATLDDVGAANGAAPYSLLRARVAWLRGLIALQQGRLAEALPYYRHAVQAYEQAGEAENAGHVLNTWADTLRVLGDYTEGWSVLGRALKAAPAFREPIRRYLVFFNASLYARRAGLLRASLLFENGALEEAHLDSRSPAAQIEARLRRASLLQELGRTAEAQTDIEFARERLRSIASGTLASYLTATLKAVESEIAANPADAVASADAALPVLEKLEPAEIPRLLHAQARAYERSRSFAEAERSLLAGIDRFETRRRQLKTDDHRVAYLDHGALLYKELASLRLLRGQGSGGAFDATERARARTLFEDIAGADSIRLSLGDIQRRLPPRTALVSYALLRDRLLTWVVTAERSSFAEGRVTPREIEQRVDTMLARIDLLAASQSLREAVRPVESLLLSPWQPAVPRGYRLVIVPDGVLHRVPFALLFTTADEPLAAAYALSITPSASLFVQAKTPAQSPASTAVPLVVGAVPAATSDGERLPDLPESLGEVKEIAALYPAGTTLHGLQATADAVSRHLPNASMFHFAGHAVADPYTPGRSRLVLAPPAADTSAGALYASDIARMNLHQLRLVVLAGCETAAGPVRSTEGVVSLSRAFLAAGAPTVVATLWQIDDRAARFAFGRVHRELREGQSVERALQRAQLAMRGSGDRVLSDPRQWGGLVVVTVGNDAPTR